jgi:hypothetical protein
MPTYAVHVRPIVRVRIEVEAKSPEAALKLAADRVAEWAPVYFRVGAPMRGLAGSTEMEFGDDFDNAGVDELAPDHQPGDLDYLRSWQERGRTTEGLELVEDLTEGACAS